MLLSWILLSFLDALGLNSGRRAWTGPSGFPFVVILIEVILDKV